MRKWLQRLFIIVVLLAATIGLNLAYVALEAQTVVVAGAPGAVLYAAGFDDFADEWQTYRGRLEAQVAASALSIRVDESATTAYSAATPSFGDFDLTVQASATAGPLNNGFGVIFRLTETSQRCDLPLPILCDLAQVDLLGVPLRLAFSSRSSAPSGYYMFLISSDGYYSVWRAEGEQAIPVSAWIDSPLVRQGLEAVNTLRVLAEGERFTFYINGEIVELCIPDDPAARSTYSAGQCFGGTMQASWQDSRFTAGKIGMVAQSIANAEAGVQVRFDALIITQPAAAPGA